MAAPDQTLHPARWEILPDVPVAVPALGYSRVAIELADLLLARTRRFSVALVGPWGAGKTTLMEAIKDRIAKLQVDAKRRAVDDSEDYAQSKTNAGFKEDERLAVQVTFDAWRFDRQEAPVVALLEAFRIGLEDWYKELMPTTFEQMANSTINRLNRFNARVSEVIVKGQLSVGLPPLSASVDITKSINGTSSGSRLLQDRLSEGLVEILGPLFDNKVRIITYLDDLDRCPPDLAIQMLSFLKMLFDIDGLIFVAGLDLDALRNRIERTDAVSGVKPDVHDFTEKIFQLTYRMPKVDGPALRQLVAMMCSSLPEDQRRHIIGDLAPHLAFLYDGGATPRQIKRFINSYVLHMRLLRQPEHFKEVIAANIIKANHSRWRITGAQCKSYVDQGCPTSGQESMNWQRWAYGFKDVEWGKVDTMVHDLDHTGGSRSLLADALLQVRTIKAGLSPADDRRRGWRNLPRFLADQLQKIRRKRNEGRLKQIVDLIGATAMELDRLMRKAHVPSSDVDSGKAALHELNALLCWLPECLDKVPDNSIKPLNEEPSKGQIRERLDELEDLLVRSGADVS